ncbi:CoA-binding protein [Seohaeicola sp. SP36]|uniref:CoA-binding protein n=1 Tax=unclassified Seohaeicola TaxID=2641111 RepID=UPI00237A5F06|nr:MULTISPECIES: CoA-binding protein [unclassified Seohaeicola]MDD9707984.1 CoA-binding protein [Seohaeicola sp. 4SK31]MDD9736747.1 CoA-binding protein [Seohaeicola sp. SP36]
MDANFAPRSVAVIGASSDPRRIGGRPVDFLRRRGFAGPILPINPKSAEVQGLPAYPSLAEAPLVPDLAVIALPASLAAKAIEECAARGVGGAVIFSSGFSEVDAEGAALQARMVDIAREAGMRLVGPNCLGIANVRQNLLPCPQIVLVSLRVFTFGQYPSVNHSGDAFEKPRFSPVPGPNFSPESCTNSGSWDRLSGGSQEIRSACRNRNTNRARTQVPVLRLRGAPEMGHNENEGPAISLLWLPQNLLGANNLDHSLYSPP